MENKASAAKKPTARMSMQPNDTTAALLALITKMDNRLAKMEAKGSGGDSGGGDCDGGTVPKGDTKNSKSKHCKHCGHKHVALEAD